MCPRRYQLAFLERLVCTSKGHSVPLVYQKKCCFQVYSGRTQLIVH
jgi:hypothetical protein